MQEKKQEDQEVQSEVDDWEINADSDDSDKNDELGAAYKDLMMVVQSGRIPFEDVEDIMASGTKTSQKMYRELIW